MKRLFLVLAIMPGASPGLASLSNAIGINPPEQGSPAAGRPHPVFSPDRGRVDG